MSCITSFTSKLVENSFDFQKSLGANAQVSGGGWGVSFSASASYSQAMSAVSSGKVKIVLSTAHCNYYFTKLNELDPPEFSVEMTKWLNNTGTLLKHMSPKDLGDEYLLDFLDYFGTHFTVETLYGARFTYEHRLKSDKSATSQSSSMSVEVQASYSGLFSLGGGFGMASSQKEAAKSFQEKSETRTISVGAPPPYNGDAMTWASTVKDTPVPVKTSLKPMSTIFSQKFRHLHQLNVSTLQELEGRIETLTKTQYCRRVLQNNQSVQFIDPVLVKLPVSIEPSFWQRFDVDAGLGENDCVNQCLQKESCVVVSKMSSGCWQSRYQLTEVAVALDVASFTYIVLSKMKTPLRLHGFKNKNPLGKFNMVIAFSDNRDKFEMLSELCEYFCSLSSACESFAVAVNQGDYAYNCATYGKASKIADDLQKTPNGLFDVQITSTSLKERAVEKQYTFGLRLPPMSNNGLNSIEQLADMQKSECHGSCSSSTDCMVSKWNSDRCIHYSGNGLYAVPKSVTNECGENRPEVRAEILRCFNETALVAEYDLDSWAVYPRHHISDWVNITSLGFVVSERCKLKEYPNQSLERCLVKCIEDPSCVALSMKPGKCSLLWTPDEEASSSCFQYEENSKVYIPSLDVKAERMKVN